MFSEIFERFVTKSPIAVMARALIERVFCPEFLDDWFARTADRQYTRTLLFSTLFDLMSQVVCGMSPSVGAAYQASEASIGVSVVAVYDKLKRLEVTTSAELVRHTAATVTPLIEELGGPRPPVFPGYRLKILDGNWLGATDHRLAVLRELAAGALPGKSLVVYDPALGLPTDVFPCEDGHAQERALLGAVLATVQAGDVWMADRNMCTLGFTCGLDDRWACFVIREHANYPWTSAGPEVLSGHTDTGTVYEQPITVIDDAGRTHAFRRIRVALKTATRDGDLEVALISNLPPTTASATDIADSYRTRWTIETAFQELTEHLQSEITTLGYPPAALFGFCVALVAYMLLQVTKAALRQAHGAETVNQVVSGYYLADELAGVSRGMLIALPGEEWRPFRTMTTAEFVIELVRIASHATLARYRKHPRRPKKPAPQKVSDKQIPHVSTARLLRKGAE
jgi:Transposase DDE domain